MATDLTPGTITNLGNLRPGDVGEFIDKTLSPEIGRFLVNSCVTGDCVYCLNDDRYYEGYRKVKTAVRYLGRGRIEPSRIVMDGEADLAEQVRTLREALKWMISEESDWENGEVGVGHKFRAKARAALAATAPKEERR